MFHLSSRPLAGRRRTGPGSLTARVVLAVVAMLLPAAPSAVASEAVLDAAGVPEMGAVRPLGVEAPRDRSLLVVHYHRPDGDYDRWNVWAWVDGAEGEAVDFTRRDAFGAVAVVELPRDAERGNFLIRLGDWERKDVGHDRSAALGEDRVAEVWLIAGDPTVHTDPDEIDFSLKARAAFLDGLDRIRVTLTRPVEVDELGTGIASVEVGGEDVAVRRVRPVGAKERLAKTLDIHLSRELEPGEVVEPVVLKLESLAPVRVTPRDALSARAFTALDAELGPSYSRNETTFRTWSPVSSRVEMLLYEGIDAESPARRVELSRGERGVWEASVAGDLHGRFYQYRFHHDFYRRHDGDAAAPPAVPDIHAFAATPDSRRSMVVDLTRTDPDGFADHAPPRLRRATDEVIYEIHVRDFSVADANIPEAHRGRYLGMTHDVAEGRGGVSTSLAHLKDLGVSAVHLLPIQDFGSERHAYNWGYWTTLFNVPESQYSTTPHDPAGTIGELKRTIQTLHDHNLRVILDVVYNHTAITGDPDPYAAAMPGYFYRTTDAGELRNDAGTGNSVADERPMVRKFILDSLAYWVREYRVDGFRFDLVGTHHPDTVEAITKRLLALRSDLTLYGEPWTGGGPLYFGKGAQRGLGFAVFNDHFRNAVRGDLDGKATGFATGPGGDFDAVRRGISGAIDDFADHPTETIHYVSAHDNRTFWDKLVYSHPAASDAARLRMHRLAHGMVLTAQGVAFIHGGADFARTKGGNHNSYNAGDAVNRFDWGRKADHLDTHRYLAGLIELRRRHPAFRMSQASKVRANLKFLNTPHGIVAYELDGRAAGDRWDRIVVAYNGQPQSKALDLPGGTWRVVVNGGRAGVKAFDRARGDVTLPPFTMWVAYQR